MQPDSFSIEITLSSLWLIYSKYIDTHVNKHLNHFFHKKSQFGCQKYAKFFVHFQFGISAHLLYGKSDVIPILWPKNSCYGLISAVQVPVNFHVIVFLAHHMNKYTTVSCVDTGNIYPSEKMSNMSKSYTSDVHNCIMIQLYSVQSKFGNLRAV